MYNFLTFSDSAKYADIAKNIVGGLGFGSNFSFWSTSVFEYIKTKLFPSLSTPPVMPYSIAVFFKIFGVGDFAVIATSMFYFILTLIFVFLLARKIFKSNLVGVLSTLVVGGSYHLIHYALSGASESPFIFEIVAASYFASLKKKWASVATFFVLVLMYFTRPQAFIYIIGVILYWLLVNFKPKKAVICFAGVLVAGFLVDYFVLLPLNGKSFLYSILGRGIGSSFNQTSVASDALRGAAGPVSGGVVQILKNIFYNLYNFYKSLSEIINPYIFTLFAVGLFLKSKSEEEQSFKISSAVIVLITLLVIAASIPFYRYIHPIIPLVYILGTGTLVGIISDQASIIKKNQNSKFQILNSHFVILSSLFLILLFGVGQTLGVLFLDSRFERNIHNVDKPPVYVELSKILKENTSSDQIVVTNLDTWGSWYGERRTVWFPVEPKQLIDPATGQIPFNAIYLTSYLIDDQNYYMGENWRLIFENPKDPQKWTCEGCSEISKEFKLKGVYKISETDNFEKQEASAVLLIKK